jgi:hypothetical protein
VIALLCAPRVFAQSSEPAPQSTTEPGQPARSAAPATEPADSPSSDEASPAADATAPPPPPQGRPPAHYYVEGDSKPPPRPAPAPRTYEPPPPGAAPILVYEPPPPPKPRHRSPQTAFWVGARLGWFVPFGNLWFDGYAISRDEIAYLRRSFQDYASSGPLFEIDVGARLGRRYNLFALWERASLGAGDLDENAFGGQDRGTTDLYGIGVRFSSDPDRVGFLAEIVIGYRRFVARWSDGTELEVTDGLFDARIGLGADIRISPSFSLSPLLTIGSGVFQEATFSGPSMSGDARTPLDENAQYLTFTIALGGHFDIY